MPGPDGRGGTPVAGLSGGTKGARRADAPRVGAGAGWAGVRAPPGRVRAFPAWVEERVSTMVGGSQADTAPTPIRTMACCVRRARLTAKIIMAKSLINLSNEGNDLAMIYVKLIYYVKNVSPLLMKIRIHIIRLTY